MNILHIIFAILVILLLSYIITILYDNSETAIKYFKENDDATKTDIKNLDSINNSRCMYYPRPIELNKEAKLKKIEDKDIDLYNNSRNVENNGFSNELIKKNINDYADIDRYFNNEIKIADKKIYSDNDINKFNIEKKECATTLPIGNIDINYLINNNTSKLS